jgi:hypothetical protein
MLEAATESTIITETYHLCQISNESIINHTQYFKNLIFHNILNTLYNDRQYGAQDITTLPYTSSVSFIGESGVVRL